jgi:hypothetical protein
MSLEQRIEELTAAVIALTTAMAGGRTAVALLPVVEDQPKEKPEAKKPDAASKETAPAKSAESGEPSASTVALSYDHVKEAILAIAAKNRDHATALLQRYGAKTGKDLSQEQWPEFHSDAQRVIAGDYDPTEAQ